MPKNIISAVVNTWKKKIITIAQQCARKNLLSVGIRDEIRLWVWGNIRRVIAEHILNNKVNGTPQIVRMNLMTKSTPCPRDSTGALINEYKAERFL